MKKLLSLLLIFVFGLLLVACGKKDKEVELTEEQAAAFLETVDVEALLTPDLTGHAYQQTSNVSFDIDANITQPGTSNLLKLITKGSLGTDVYISGSEDVNDVVALLKVNGDAEFDYEYRAVNTYDSVIQQFSGDVDLNLSAFIMEASLYIDASAALALKQGAITMTLDPKVEKVKISDLDLTDSLQSFIDALAEVTVGSSQTLPDIDFSQFEEYLGVKVTKSGNDHKIEYTINKEILTEIVEVAFMYIFAGNLENPIEIPEPYKTYINDAIAAFQTFEVKVIIESKGTDNQIAKVTTTINIKVNYDETILVDEDVTLKVILKLELNASTVYDFNPSAPELSSEGYTNKTLAQLEQDLEGMFSNLVN